MHVPLVLALLVAGPGMLVSNTAQAAPSDDQAAKDERARELYENGRTLYDEGAYEAAVEAWQAAYDLSPKPLLLFNLTSAHERLGNLEKALETLNKYRIYAPAAERETLEARIRNLEKRIQDAADQAPEPQTPPDPIGPAPAPAPEPGPEPRGNDALGLMIIGAGGASLITGTVFALQASSARSQLGDACAEGANGVTLCRPDAADLHKKDNTSSVVADVGLLLGVVGVGIGTVVVLGKGPKSADVWAQPLPGGAGAGLSGHF